MVVQFSLFPYTQLWRIGNDHYHTNKCGFFISLFIILVIIGVLTERSIAVFKSQTITSTSYFRIQTGPPEATLSTSQLSTDFYPFMIAFDITNSSNLSNHSQVNINAFIDSSQKVNATVRNNTMTPIPLEQCTSDHFSKLPRVNELFPQMEAQHWQCLPLNSSYKLEGLQFLKGNFQSLSFTFNCSNCNKNYTVEIYTLNTIFNAANQSQPANFYLDHTSIPIELGMFQHFDFDLIKSILNTDTSWFPWPNYNITQSLELERHKLKNEHVFVDSFLQITFKISPKTHIYDAVHLKFLDAFAFVGGIFQSLIGTFVIITVFGRMFFQFRFAKLYLQSEKTAKNFNLFGYIKQVVFQVLQFFNIKLKWELAQRRHRVRNSINNVLDMVFMIRRVDYLQKSMAALFQEHQLKGLHLHSKISLEQVDKNFYKYSFGERLMYYVAYKKKLIKKQEGDDSSDESSHREQEILARDLFQHTKDRQRGRMERERDGDANIESANSLKKLPNDALYAEFNNKGPNNSIVLPEGQDGRGLRFKIYKYQLEKSPEEKLFEIVRHMKYMSEEQINAEELRKWLRTDFQKLMIDAHEDKRSRRILDQVEDWFLDLLKEAARDQLENIQSKMKEIILEPLSGPL